MSFSIVNRPPWASFSTSSGRLSGTPTLAAAGEYIDIRISVSDGQASASLAPFSIFAFPQSSYGSATLYWQPPTTRTDGTPLTNLDGYRIRYGTAVGSYPNMIDITNEGLTSAVISNLPPATYYFVLSAYDAAGAESANAGPVSKVIG